MQNVSSRSLHAYQSPIRKLMKYANEATKKGKNIYFLNIGQPDVPAPILPSELKMNWDRAYIPYGSSEGEESLRRAFQEYYLSWGIDLDQEDILITTGASEALLLSLYAVLDPQEELIVQEPFYANYNGISQMAGVNIKPVYTPFEEGFPIPGIEVFENLLTEKTKAFLLCNPNNPTGKVYQREMLLQLAELVLKHDLFLIVDEVYREFCYDNEFFSVLNLEHIRDRVIVLDSISKRYNSCGVRIGCIVTRNNKIREMILKYAQLRLSPPMMGQQYAEQVLNPPREFMDDMIEKFRARRNYLSERLRRIEGVEVNDPEGAFYVFARLPVEDSEAFCKWMLTDFEHEGQTVMLAPGNGFYATEGKGNDQVRLAYVLELDKLEKAMDCLEKGLKSYPLSYINPHYKMNATL